MTFRGYVAWRMAWLGIVLLPMSSYALTWQEALRQSERHAPELEEQEHALAAAKSDRVSAGELPDPQLVTGVDNLPVQGSEAWNPNRDFMTMQRIGIAQSVTNGDKRAAARQMADANIERTRREGSMVRFSVRRDTLIAWLKLYFVNQRKSLLDQLDAESRLQRSALEVALSTGRKGVDADVQRVRQIQAELSDRRDELERDERADRSSLSRWVGREAASEPVTGPLPPYLASAGHGSPGLADHPDLAVLRAREAEAQAAVDMARAGKRSDWGMEVDYEHRPPSFGDMVSVQFTFALPVLTQSRQDPQIAARQQDLDRVRAKREAVARQHTEEVENLLANAALYAREMERMDREWLPLKQERVRTAQAGYRAGQEDLEAVLMARRDLLLARMRRIDLEEKRSLVDAEWRYVTSEGKP